MSRAEAEEILERVREVGVIRPRDLASDNRLPLLRIRMANANPASTGAASSSSTSRQLLSLRHRQA